MRRIARVLSLLGPLGVVFALSKYHADNLGDPPYNYVESFRFAWSLGYAAVLTVAAYGLGLPDLPGDRRRVASAALGASVLAALAVSIAQLALGDALLPRFVVFGAAVVTVPLHLLASTLARTGESWGEARDRVLFVGGDSEGDRLRTDIEVAPERPSVVVAQLAPSEAVAALAADKPLVAAVLDHRVTVIVLDRRAQEESSIVDQVAVLHERGIRVRSLAQFYEEWLAKLPISELERTSLFFDISEVHRIRYGRAKRLIDLVGALVGLVVLVVVTPLVVVANLVANRGPLLYRQERVGRGGRSFRILKFRSMVPHASSAGDAPWTERDDPRITPFGRLLRASHLDELPQVVNVLRGELSLVGPRPEQPRYVRELSERLPFYGMRHLVRPGLTGWAQVKYGYAGDERDAIEKLQYEFFYLRNQSLRFDLRVLGRTVRSVLGGSGRGR